MNNEQLKKLLSLPEIKDDRLIFTDTVTPPKPGGIVPCLLCTKPFLMGIYIGEPDQLCPECQKTYSDTAKIICARCKPPVTICRVIPKILDNGYYIRPKSVLHVDRCNVCSPGLTESVIIEIAEWERTRRQKKVIIHRA